MFRRIKLKASRSSFFISGCEKVLIINATIKIIFIEIAIIIKINPNIQSKENGPEICIKKRIVPITNERNATTFEVFTSKSIIWNKGEFVLHILYSFIIISFLKPFNLPSDVHGHSYDDKETYRTCQQCCFF